MDCGVFVCTKKEPCGSLLAEEVSLPLCEVFDGFLYRQHCDVAIVPWAAVRLYPSTGGAVGAVVGGDVCALRKSDSIAFIEWLNSVRDTDVVASDCDFGDAIEVSHCVSFLPLGGAVMLFTLIIILSFVRVSTIILCLCKVFFLYLFNALKCLLLCVFVLPTRPCVPSLLLLCLVSSG